MHARLGSIPDAALRQKAESARGTVQDSEQTLAGEALAAELARSFAASHFSTSETFACMRLIGRLAEREGFEPPIPVKVWLISSQLHSTGLCHLSVVSLL